MMILHWKRNRKKCPNLTLPRECTHWFVSSMGFWVCEFSTCDFEWQTIYSEIMELARAIWTCPVGVIVPWKSLFLFSFYLKQKRNFLQRTSWKVDQGGVIFNYEFKVLLSNFFPVQCSFAKWIQKLVGVVVLLPSYTLHVGSKQFTRHLCK